MGTENGENGDRHNYDALVWVFFIISFVSGLLMQLQGLATISRGSGNHYLWWWTDYSLLSYMFLTPFCFISLALLGMEIKRSDSWLVIGTSMASGGTGALWIVYCLLYSAAQNHIGVELAIAFWGFSIFFFGVTFILMGILFLKQEPTLLSRVTAISFLLTGLIGLVVGNVYDYPWVTAVALFPCFLALVHFFSDS